MPIQFKHAYIVHNKFTKKNRNYNKKLQINKIKNITGVLESLSSFGGPKKDCIFNTIWFGKYLYLALKSVYRPRPCHFQQWTTSMELVHVLNCTCMTWFTHYLLESMRIFCIFPKEMGTWQFYIHIHRKLVYIYLFTM